MSASDNPTLEFGTYQSQGGRLYQEDEFCVEEVKFGERKAHYIGVFDGHGTNKFAKHVKEHLHKFIFDEKFSEKEVEDSIIRAFQNEDRLLLDVTEEVREGGTTVTVAIIADMELYVGNVGDSRAVIIQVAEEGHYKPKRVTVDHKPTIPEELQRIKENGGHVFFGRVQGIINITRALGDHMFKFPFNKAALDNDESVSGDFLSASPNIDTTQLQKDVDRYLIVASDGVWSAFSDEEIADLIKKEEENGKTTQDIAEEIVNETVEKQPGPACDNVTCILTKFKWGSK